MSKVFVDTAAWLALVNKDDGLHTQAVQVKDKLQTWVSASCANGQPTPEPLPGGEMLSRFVRG